MTRREFAIAAVAGVAPAGRVTVPVHRIVDAKARFAPGALERFWRSLWPEAVRDFGRGGIALAATDGPGEMQITAADRPLFTGLRRGSLNLLVTDRLPLYWDNARLLPGATTLDRGFALSAIALRYAHGDRTPFLSVNTCVHEMLHALLLDIFIKRPSAYESARREYRIDWFATRMWLFHDGAAVRRDAREFLRRIS